MSNRRNNYVKHKGRRKRKTRSSRSSRPPGTSTASATPTASAGTASASQAAATPTGGPRLESWWQRIPGRLEYEQQLLNKLGVRWELDPKEFAEGRVVIRITVQREGEDVLLVARFPDVYPYLRFELVAAGLNLLHHQNPFDKNLCFLGQGTKNWNTNDTLAGILATQLPLLFETGASEVRSASEGKEDAQGEPISAYYKYQKDTVLIIDGAWAVDPDIHRGKLLIGFSQRPEASWIGAVLEIQSEDGTVLFEIDPRLRRSFRKTIPGRWVRSPEPIVKVEPDPFWERLLALDPSLEMREWRFLDSRQSIDLVGVVQPEEHRYREHSDGWAFLAHHRIKSNDLFDIVKYPVRVDRAGPTDFAIRIPELSTLSKQRIALVGLGCIGAPSAIHFAKGGTGELRIVDGDVIDAGPTVRWPLGLTAIGRSKAEAIAEFIESNYPYTEVTAFHHKIGSAPLAGSLNDSEVLAQLLDGADLIYDASAEMGIQHLLSDLARQRGLPYIGIETTPGGWGGIIVRIRPGLTAGCWTCLQHCFNDGTIPLPPSDDGDLVQPQGCGNPTFKAASFDVEEISLQGVRLAVSSLSETARGAYPATDWDVAIISLRNEEGHLIATEVETHSLNRHPECKNHTA